nr:MULTISPECIES: DUF202 domain-containing protein [unclassified Rhodococcus (in: high G+C Gram-positive bacteria)]
MPPLHSDPGLQPERTSLSWHRTQASLIIVSVLFVRWYPTWGAFAFAPVALACTTTLAISATQRRRYERSCASIAAAPLGPDIGGAIAIAASCAAIGAAGTAVLLVTA